MNDRNEADEELFDDMVDQHRRYLRGRGPRPDTSEVPDRLRGDLEETFGVLAAITGMGDDVVPAADEDPLFERLGFGRANSGDAATSHATGVSPVNGAESALTRELEAFAVDDAMLEFGNGARPGETLSVVAVYRHWGSVVRVCVVDGGIGELVSLDTMRAIERVFADWPDTTLVAAVIDDEELSCIVAQPQDCVNAIDPSAGAVGPSRNFPVLPVGMALARCFEFTNPVWDDVPLSPFEVESFDMVAAAELSADQALSSVLTQSRRMPEKALALDSLATKERSWLTSLPTLLATSDFDLDEALNELAEAHT